MFIDEAYSLAQAVGTETNPDDDMKRPEYDPYGVEAINEIVGFLDKNKGQICVITAGYEREMKQYFFDVNPGMLRRFGYHFRLSEFSPSELFDILKFMLKTFYDVPLERLTGTEGQEVIYRVLSDVSQSSSDERAQEEQSPTSNCSLPPAIQASPLQQLIRSGVSDDFYVGLRDFFQNEAGDIENLAADLSSAFFVLGTTLNREIVVEVIWNYVKQRDGRVNIRRGEPLSYPKIFNNNKELFLERLNLIYDF
jgi:hypothetical protein